MLHYTYAFLAFNYYCALKEPYNLKNSGYIFQLITNICSCQAVIVDSLL